MTVSVAARDASAIILGVCAPYTPDPPTLRSGTETSLAVGGLLELWDEGAINYFIYAPMTPTTIEVHSANKLIATAEFEEMVPSTCEIAAPSGVRFLACESIVNVEWDTKILLDASVKGVEATVTEADVGREQLGFYLFDTKTGPSGLTLVFGFQRPDADNDVIVRITKMFTSEREVTLEPALTMRLSSTGNVEVVRSVSQ